MSALLNSPSNAAVKWVVWRHAEGSELQVVFLVVGVVEQRHLEERHCLVQGGAIRQKNSRQVILPHDTADFSGQDQQIF